MKKRSGLFARTVAAALSMGLLTAPTAQTKAENLNSNTSKSVGEANKNAVEEQKKKGGQEVADVDPMTGGLKFNHPTMYAHTSPIYFPRKHPKMTWNQQRQKAKQRRKSKA